VLREVGSSTRSVFEQALSRLGIRPEKLRIAMELDTSINSRFDAETGYGA
jgi:hypothetical protein